MSGGVTNGGDALPPPTTGRALPVDDDAVVERVSQVMGAYDRIFIEYPRQRAIINRIRVLQIRSRGRRGTPLKGARLSQVSQAGKSKLLERFRDEANAQPGPDGVVNPFRVLYLGLEVRETLKMVCVRLLRLLGDPHASQGNEGDVKLRLQEFIAVRGVEVLIIDEVQHLDGETNSKVDITDELKRLLDRGIVPLVLAGNEKSGPFFDRNEQLAARLGAPLGLDPLRPGKDRAEENRLFKQFCADLDRALQSGGMTRRASGLIEATTLRGLARASGGHVGRVCRIVEAALEYAISREAEFVERHDLAHAVETFAIPMRYCSSNPFAS